MLGLIVLFTVFLGLVGMLIISQEVQRRLAAAGSRAPSENLRSLEAWLAGVGCHLPSAREVTAVLGRIASRGVQPVNEEWHSLEVSGLLPGTELPQLTITKATTNEQQHCIEMVVNVEWPMCVPGVGVVVAMETGRKVTCHLQADWMYAELKVVLAHSSSAGLLLSMEHRSEPKMALSCLVVTPEVKNPERLASSVADAIHYVFHSLQLSQEPLAGEPLTPPHSTAGSQSPTHNFLPSHSVVPTVLVSAPEEEGEGPGKEEAESGDGTGKGDTETDQSSTLVGSSEAQDAAHTVVEEEPPSSQPVEPRAALHDAMPSSTVLEPEDRKEDESTQSTTATAVVNAPVVGVPVVAREESPSPHSPPWRRTPSYEQLQQIALLSSPPDSKPPPEGLVHRRALSVAGSEGLGDDSSYGGDSTFPSTLVFESIDSTRVRHIVALSPAHASKLRRQLGHAKKLHIYNDHTFKATRFKERPLCAVCKVKIVGLFGKQGYACRDCGLTVHKDCHYKVESQCPTSQVTSMNLIYPDSVSTISSV